jgi:hypothetical protein
MKIAVYNQNMYKDYKKKNVYHCVTWTRVYVQLATALQNTSVKVGQMVGR